MGTRRPESVGTGVICCTPDPVETWVFLGEHCISLHRGLNLFDQQLGFLGSNPALSLIWG